MVEGMSDKKGRSQPDDRSAWEAIAEGPAMWEALGRAIKVERTARGWERKELAGRAGLSYPYLSEIETGKKRPSWSALGGIAEALGLRASQLLEQAETWPLRHGAHPGWLTGEQSMVAAAFEMAPASRVNRRQGSRAEILRELLGYLEQLPVEDLEKLRRLARTLTD
jgi:transcriptional regulator with XRE-family HTH domain